MSVWLVSPTERNEDLLSGLDAVSSSIPETRGCDLLNYLPNGYILGIQRKQVPHDFIKSIDDGRFSKELPLMREMTTSPFVLVEGKFTYSLRTGKVIIPGTNIVLRHTRAGIEAMKLSMKYLHGVDVIETMDAKDTVWWAKRLMTYLSKPVHGSFMSRSPLASEWGKPTYEERLIYFYQGLPMTGVGMAKTLAKRYPVPRDL